MNNDRINPIGPYRVDASYDPDPHPMDLKLFVWRATSGVWIWEVASPGRLRPWRMWGHGRTVDWRTAPTFEEAVEVGLATLAVHHLRNK